MIYIGHDPGKSGATAFLPDDGEPWFVKNTETLTDITEAIREASLHTRIAMLETVHSSPQMGVKSAFSFGQSLGQIEGIFTGIGLPFERVRPQAWQKAMQCLTKGDKNVSKAKAQELFPQIKITHAIADALLLAEYAKRQTK